MVSKARRPSRQTRVSGGKVWSRSSCSGSLCFNPNLDIFLTSSVSSPGVARVAEDLQRERCKDLERQVHELRLQNDILRDDILRVRLRVQELQNTLDAPATSGLQATPLKKSSEMDPEMIRDLLNTINRLHAEKEEVQTQSSVYKGLLDLAKLDEFTKTIEEKERIILELSAQLGELQHDSLSSSSVIYPVSARNGSLSSSAEMVTSSGVLDPVDKDEPSIGQGGNAEGGVIEQLKYALFAIHG
jgi:hypothetical protein